MFWSPNAVGAGPSSPIGFSCSAGKGAFMKGACAVGTPSTTLDIQISYIEPRAVAKEAT